MGRIELPVQDDSGLAAAACPSPTTMASTSLRTKRPRARAVRGSSFVLTESRGARPVRRAGGAARGVPREPSVSPLAG